MLHQIGSGVLGPVFRTYDPQRDRLIAVKAFRLDLVPEDVARLADALRRLAAASPAHVNLVPAVDAGLEGATAFLAMDYVAGETLDVAFRHLAPAPLDRALPVLTQIADALEAGWAVGLGHGALHPRDVFLIAGTNDVRVTGTGVVPALEATGVKAPVRRPYTAPERAAGDEWDVRADVYSLGAIAHELLTRRRPAAPGEQDGALATGLTPEQRVHVRRILSAALAERPEHRFATPKAFSDALAAVARGEAPSLPPEPQAVSASGEKTPPAKKKPITTPLLEAIETLPAEAPLPAVIEPMAPTGKESAAPPAATVIVPVEPPQDDDTLSHFKSEGRAAAPPPPPPPPLPPPPPVEPAPRLLREVVPSSSPPPHERPAAAVAPPPPAPPPERATLFSEPPAATTSIRPEPFTSRARSVPPPFLTPPPSTPSFPWAAIIAAAVAALAIGGVGGWAIGRSQAPPSAASTPAPAADTDVRVPAPVVTPRPETTPPRATATPDATPARATAPPEPARPATSPKPTPETRAAATHGTVTIKSSPPGALVTIDGHPHGMTPATVRDLLLGSHTLQVARPGYVPSSQPLVLTATQPSQEITVELKPSADIRAAEAGSISVDTRPRGARVTIDGRTAGTTPVRITSVAPGSHNVRIELAGYKDVLTVVVVKGGAETPIQVTLEPVDGRRAASKKY